MAGEPVWSAPGRELLQLKSLDGHLPEAGYACRCGATTWGGEERVRRPPRFGEEEEESLSLLSKVSSARLESSSGKEVFVRTW